MPKASCSRDQIRRANQHASSSRDRGGGDLEPPADVIRRGVAEMRMRDSVRFNVSRRGVLVGTVAAAGASSLGSPAGAQDADEPNTPIISRVSLTVNGQARTLSVDARTSLLDLLREHFHLT